MADERKASGRRAGGNIGFPVIVLFVSLVSIMGLGFAADSARPPVIRNFSNLDSYPEGTQLDVKGVLVGIDGGTLYISDDSGDVLPVYVRSGKVEPVSLDIVTARGTVMMGRNGPYLSCTSPSAVSAISHYTPTTTGVGTMVDNNISGVVRAIGMIHSIIYHGSMPGGLRLEENGTVIEAHFVDFNMAFTPGMIVAVTGVYKPSTGCFNVYSKAHVTVINNTGHYMPVNIYNLIQNPEVWVGRDVTASGEVRYGGDGFTAISPEGSDFRYSLKVKLHSDMNLQRGDLVELKAFRFTYSTRHGYYFLEEMPLSAISILRKGPVWNLTLEEIMENVNDYAGSTVETRGNYWCRNGVASIYSGEYSLLLDTDVILSDRTPIVVRGVLRYDTNRGAYVLDAGDAVWPLQ